MKYGRIHLLTWAIVGICLSLPAPAVAQEGRGIEFLAMPKPGPSEHNGYFMFEADRGVTVTQRLQLRNDADHTQTLQLEPVDAKTALYGGVDYGLAGEKIEAVGTWIELHRSRVRLAPGESTVVAFDVSVPSDAPGGQNLAGIGIYAVGDEGANQESAADGMSAQVVVIQRRVVAVQVNIPGGAAPRLEIQGVTPLTRAEGIYLGIEIAASGGGMTDGGGTIQIADDDGFEQDFTLETVVPGTEMVYPILWRDSASNGEYPVSVEITYGDGRKIAEWSGMFTIGEGLQADLSDKGGRGQQGGIPIPALVGVIITLVFLAWHLRRRIRPLSGPVVVPMPLKLQPQSSAEPVAPPLELPTLPAEMPARPAARLTPPPPPPAKPVFVPITTPPITASQNGAPRPAAERLRAVPQQNGHQRSLIRRVNGKVIPADTEEIAVNKEIELIDREVALDGKEVVLDPFQPAQVTPQKRAG